MVLFCVCMFAGFECRVWNSVDCFLLQDSFHNKWGHGIEPFKDETVLYKDLVCTAQ
jgi:hypothetical protein